MLRHGTCTPPRSAPSRWSFPTADTPSMPSPTSARTPGRCPKPRCGRCAAHGTLTDQTPERFPCPPCGRLPCAARRRSLLNSCGPWRRSISATPWLPISEIRSPCVPYVCATSRASRRSSARAASPQTGSAPRRKPSRRTATAIPPFTTSRRTCRARTSRFRDRSRRTRPMPRNMPLIS